MYILREHTKLYFCLSELKVEHQFLYCCHCSLSLTPHCCQAETDLIKQQRVMCVCVCAVYFLCAFVSFSECLPVHPCVCVSAPVSACLPDLLPVCRVFTVRSDSGRCSFLRSKRGSATSCHKTKTTAGKEEGGGWRCTGTAATFLSRPLF